jgi:hypothetical protein
MGGTACSDVGGTISSPTVGGESSSSLEERLGLPLGRLCDVSMSVSRLGLLLCLSDGSVTVASAWKVSLCLE